LTHFLLSFPDTNLSFQKKKRRGSLNIDDVKGVDYGKIDHEAVKELQSKPWYRPLPEAMQEYEKDAVGVSGHIVVLSPSLDDIGALLEMLRLPHLAERAVVILTPIHVVENKNELREMEMDWEEIMQFPHIHLVPGFHDDTNALWRAGVSRAHSAMIFSQRAEGLVADSRFIDSALITKQLSITAELSHAKRVLVELNDATVIQHVGFVTESAIVNGRENGHRPSSSHSPKGRTSRPASPIVRPMTPVSRSPSPLSSGSRPSTPMGGGGPSHFGHHDGSHRARPAAANSDRLYDPNGQSERVVVNRHYQLEPAYLAGDVVMSNVSALLLCQAFFNPHIIGIITVLIGASMEDADDDGVARSSMVQIVLPAEFKHSGVSKVEDHGVVQWRYEDVFNFLMEKDILPVALFRIGYNSRDALHLNIGEGERNSMPESSFLITNPTMDQMVGEHDLVCVCMHSQDTYNKMKMEDSPFSNFAPPLSHEGRRLSHVEAGLGFGEGEGAAAGAGVNKSVSQLHKSVHTLLSSASGGSGNATVSSDFTRLQQSLDHLVKSAVDKDREVLELQNKIQVCEKVLGVTGVARSDKPRQPSPTHPTQHPLTPYDPEDGP
jgi:hypothetical protein